MAALARLEADLDKRPAALFVDPDPPSVVAIRAAAPVAALARVLMTNGAVRGDR